MRTDFIERGNWILPVEGTLGNKAQNLHNNTATIREAGFKVPRSLVMPFEYLAAKEDQAQLVLETIDRYFPGWTMALVRSNSPDEDVGLRFPGLYRSEHIWHKDRDYAAVKLEEVTRSYSDLAAVARRAQFGLPELGMCLLIMEPVTNTPGSFDASYAGCFSDIGELAILTFTNPKSGLEAMLTRPEKRLRIDKNGQHVDGIPPNGFTTQEYDLGRRLRILADNLPQIQGKGWELEFVGNQDGDYIVQTTPITKKARIIIPEKIDNIFEAESIVGTGEFSSNGILYVPFAYDYNQVMEFDRLHANYCLFADPANFMLGHSVLRFLLNPSVIISLKYNYTHDIPFPQHVQQYMREGRIAMDGDFTNPNFSNIQLKLGRWINDGKTGDIVHSLAYSPTKLFVAGDEFSQKGVVSLAGEPHHFTLLSRL